MQTKPSSSWYRFVFWGLVTLFIVSPALPRIARAADEAPVVPLPAGVAEHLELLGKGVVGKACPAPEITDVNEYLNLGPGTWEYKIVSGGKAGEEVRKEHYEKMPDQDGDQIWKRFIGSELIVYLNIDPNHDFGKRLEEDQDVGYSSRFDPGLVWLAKAKAGSTRIVDSKIQAFKTGDPGHVSFHGKMKSRVTYVGCYEVTTPAGTFPSLLMQTDFDIDIGPADVTDTQYMFYAKGVGMVASIEATHVSAMLVYHSNTRVAKLLSSYPKR